MNTDMSLILLDTGLPVDYS